MTLRIAISEITKSFPLKAAEAYTDEPMSVTVRAASARQIQKFLDRFGRITTEATEDGVRVFSEQNPTARLWNLLYIGLADLDVVDEDTGERLLIFKDDKVDMSYTDFTKIIARLPMDVVSEIAGRIVEVNPSLQ